MTRNTANRRIFQLLTLLSSITTIVAFVQAAYPLAALGLAGAILFALVWLVHERSAHWREAGAVTVSVFIAASAVVYTLATDQYVPSVMLVPILMVLMTTQRRTMVLSAGIAWLLPVVVFALQHSDHLWSYSHILVTLLYVAMVAIAMLVHRVQETYVAHLQAETQRTRAANTHLQASHAALEAQLHREQLLLAQVEELEVPFIGMGTTLFIPLVGTLDDQRMARLMTRTLQRVQAGHETRVVFDCTGLLGHVPVESFFRLTDMIRLIGCQVGMTGISAHLARAMVDVSIPHHLVMYPTLTEAFVWI